MDRRNIACIPDGKPATGHFSWRLRRGLDPRSEPAADRRRQPMDDAQCDVQLERHNVRVACFGPTSQTSSSLLPQISAGISLPRSEEHTSELQSHLNLVCRLLLEKKKKTTH